MKPIRLMTGLVFVAAVAAAVAGWKKVGQLQAEITALRVEIQGASEHNAATAEAESKQREQEMQRVRSDAQEVHKLRNEVAQLRPTAKDSEKLRGENQQLRAENQQLRTAASRPPLAAPATKVEIAGKSFPKQAWSFAGYGTPEASLMSAIWAMREGNPKTYLDSLSPEEQLRMAKSWQNKSEAEIAAKHQQDVSVITGMRILGQQTVSANEVTMDVFVEGVNRPEKVSMKRVGNDWKFGGYIRSPAQ